MSLSFPDNYSSSVMWVVVVLVEWQQPFWVVWRLKYSISFTGRCQKRIGFKYKESRSDPLPTMYKNTRFTNFWPIFPFHTSGKRKKAFSFLVFFGKYKIATLTRNGFMWLALMWLSTNPTKSSNAHKQFVGSLSTKYVWPFGGVRA